MSETHAVHPPTDPRQDPVDIQTDNCDTSLFLVNQHSDEGTQKPYKRDHSSLDDNAHGHSKITPSPLSLPKRFSVSSLKDRTSSQVRVPPSQHQSQLPQNVPQFQHPIYPIQQISLPAQRKSQNPIMPQYQQMFYNPQTGSVMSVPVATPPQIHPQAHPQGHQMMYMLPGNSIPQQNGPVSQIVYMKSPSGQLIPVLTPVTSMNNVPSYPVFSPSNSENANQFSNKRQKVTSPSSALNAASSVTQSAERLQREQIQIQLQRNPDINKFSNSSNISDIYNVDEIVDVSNTTPIVKNDENIKPNDIKDATTPVIVDDGNHEDETGLNDEQVTDNNNNLKSQVVSNENSTNSISSTSHLASTNSILSNVSNNSAISSKKITGTLTLGAFTYKYSQTLSNNPIKDRELFDRLTENAWKTCMSKR